MASKAKGAVADNQRAARQFQTGAERVRAGKPTATDEAIMRIRHWLFTGRIVPGQRLTEADLARELGVSKAPVREAMQSLAADGLVKLAPYKGYLIHRMSRTEVAGVFDVLEVLDGLCARRGAERAAAGALTSKLQAALTTFNDSHFEISRVQPSGNEGTLNSAIMELSGNETIKQLNQRILFSIFPLQFRALQKQSVPVALLDLVRKFVVAIIAGDPKAAEAGARAHARALRDHILSLPDDWFEPESGPS